MDLHNAGPQYTTLTEAGVSTVRILVLIVVATLSPGGSSAWALECTEDEVGATLPGNLAQRQPINSRVAVEVVGDNYLEINLLHADDLSEVPATVEPIVELWRSVHLLTPDDLLEVDTQYVVEVKWPEEFGGSHFPTIFTTGSTEDTTAPGPATILDLVHRKTKDQWGTWEALELTLAGRADDSVYYEMHVAQDSSFTDAELRVLFDETGGAYENPCTGVDELATQKPSSVWTRVCAVDVAGNVSPCVEREPSARCGCNANATPAVLWFPLMLLALGHRRYTDRREKLPHPC